MKQLPVALTAQLIENFAAIYLSPRYDEARPTPPFHREGWAYYASDHSQVTLVAPRDHAKSTGFTFDYILAEVLFRTSDYVILVGSTEENSAEQLSNISEELHENEQLRRDFGIKSFEVDSRTEIIVKMADGHRFRILARGAEQRIRGKMWKGKRPNLIVGDDMEDDEQVENAARRRKFRRWFFRAARQALSQSGKIRVHGTILHEDSLMARLQKAKTWKSLFYKAHRSYDDFSEVLWPERWTEKKLRARRQEFIEDGDPGGYSQEFLNDPLDSAEAYLRRDDFIPMEEADYDAPKVICAAADFAVSKADAANRTSFTIGGKDTRNILHYTDFQVGRWDTLEWVDKMFEIQLRHNPEIFWVEDGVIWKAMRRMVYAEMQARDIIINIEAVPSVKDKATRGRVLQKRHRAGLTRWNTRAEGYEGAKEELIRFTAEAQATLDDQFDSAALLAAGFEHFGSVEPRDFYSDEELFLDEQRPRQDEGRSSVTGY